MGNITLRRTLLIFVLSMPLLNFIHEAGHWAGYKLCGASVTMKFQRVVVEENISKKVQVVGNWSGPAVNLLVVGISLLYPQQLAVVGLSAISQRLSAQIFGLPLYCLGKTRFTNDETILFPEKIRLLVCLIFILVYGALSLKFLRVMGFTTISPQTKVIALGVIFWIIYGLALNWLDKVLLKVAGL